MHKFVLAFLFSVSLTSIDAQPLMQWKKCFGGSNQDWAKAVQQTSDSGFVVVGFSESDDGDVGGNYGHADLWIVKLSSSGNIQWQNNPGGSGIECAQSVQQTKDGGYIIAAYTTSNDGDVTGNHGNRDYWILKLNDSGTIQWQKCFGGSGTDWPYSIQQTIDSGYIIIGISNSADGDVTGSHSGYDSWIVKLSSTGNIQWQKCLGGSDGDHEHSVQQTTDSGYIVAGTTRSVDGDVSGNHGNNDFWILKLSSTGIIQWQKCLGGSGNDYGEAIRQTIDGGYIAAGSSDSNDGDVSYNHGQSDYWVVKLDDTGNIQWQHSFGGSDNETAYAIQQTTDSGYIVAGETASIDGAVTGNYGLADYWIVKLDNTGITEWKECMGGSAYDEANAIQQTFDKGFIIAGFSESTNGEVTGNHGDRDFWLVKTLPDEIVGIGENRTQSFEIYPNPATEFLTIHCRETKEFSIQLINLFGQIVYSDEIHSGQMPIDVRNYAQGVYFVKMETVGYVKTEKVFFMN
ncbi:MAG TPA: T9SS type A sorting domain-containing protein [Bacteroidia bacterium]|nr:T9SS type A sorting domain-containing protein [Bacteroidia bacterium]